MNPSDHSISNIDSLKTRLEKLKILFKKQKESSDLNHVDTQNQSVFLAALQGETKELERLARDGVRLNVADEHGDSPLAFAIHEKHVEVVQFLMQRKAYNIAACSQDFLELAVMTAKEDTSILALLLENIRYLPKIPKHFDKAKAQCVAADSKPNNDAVMRLLQAYDVDLTDQNQGQSMSTVIDKHDNEEAIHSLTQAQHLWINWALRYHDWILLNRCLQKKEKKLDLNHVDMQGNQSIFLAALWGHLPVFKLLKHHKVRLNVVNEDKDSPLTIAIHEKHAAVVEFLTQNKAYDINSCSQDFLELAVITAKEDTTILALLLKTIRHLSESPKHFNKNKALRTAISMKNENSVNLLIKYGADSKKIIKTR